MKLILLLCSAYAISSVCYGEATTAIPEGIVTDAPTNETRTIMITTSGGRKRVCDVKSRGGLIMFGPNENFEAEDTVTVKIDSIKEVVKNRDDSDDDDTMSIGRDRSSFSSFDQQNFVFSDTVNGSYPGTNLSTTNFQMTATMRKINRTSNEMIEVGRINVTIYLFHESWNLTIDGERTEIYEGTLKFNIALDGFDFCNSTDDDCEGTDGVGLDVTIDVKGRGGARPKKARRVGGTDNLETFSLGGNSSLRTSSKIRVDGVWKNTSDDFLNIDQSMMTFRFDRFDTEVFYDPTIDWMIDDVYVFEEEEGTDDDVDDGDNDDMDVADDDGNADDADDGNDGDDGGASDDGNGAPSLTQTATMIFVEFAIFKYLF